MFITLMEIEASVYMSNVTTLLRYSSRVLLFLLYYYTIVNMFILGVIEQNQDYRNLLEKVTFLGQNKHNELLLNANEKMFSE